MKYCSFSYTSMENLCNSCIKNCTVDLSERAYSHEVRALKAQEREERAMFDPVSELGLTLTRFSIPSLTYTVNFSILNTKILPARVSHLVLEIYRRRGLVERISFDELSINYDWPKYGHFLPATGFYPIFFLISFSRSLFGLENWDEQKMKRESHLFAETARENRERERPSLVRFWNRINEHHLHREEGNILPEEIGPWGFVEWSWAWLGKPWLPWHNLSLREVPNLFLTCLLPVSYLQISVFGHLRHS